ncbi:multiheme c-type cytochrome [Mucilaginibacter sp.]|uniref:multiheme c-type cytochrome n=1 Tax=Mucilaginibacter sp. TaxID=1882438 RepID=UPI0025EB63E7|nr:multiheme c-type cytochrome [Mucilaginibacter sp.]
MKKINVVAAICAIMACFVYMQCKTAKPTDPRGEAYAGAATCAKCHSAISNSSLHTAHYLATVPANLNTIHGSFAKNANIFDFSPSQKIVMEKRDSGLFQTYYLNGKEAEKHRFDIVLGGVKGESYLYWHGSALNQLPVSYYSKQNQWLMSPGYMPGQVYFNRPIATRCMECHASNISGLPDKSPQLTGGEQFDKSSLVYGIDCEKCHGPGARHVEFQTNYPEVKTAKYIASFKSLPRERKLDVCGVCHSGNKSPMLRSTFGFVPGDTLANYKLPEMVSAIDTGHLDVHGNQIQLLQSSKCFMGSKLDCQTCHDTHQNQRGNLLLYSQKCLGCHSTTKHNYCKMANTIDAQLIKTNCVQCHMPALPSRVIIAPTQTKSASADILVHTHHIAIYPQQVKKVLAMAAGK